MYGWVEIEVHVTVILHLTNFLDFSQVTRLKSGVEEDGRILDVAWGEHDWILC